MTYRAPRQFRFELVESPLRVNVFASGESAETLISAIFPDGSAQRINCNGGERSLSATARRAFFRVVSLGFDRWRGTMRKHTAVPLGEIMVDPYLRRGRCTRCTVEFHIPRSADFSDVLNWTRTHTCGAMDPEGTP